MSKAITILNGLISTAFKKDARKFSEKLAKTEEEDFNEQEFLAELLAADSERIKNLKENVRSDVSKEAKHVLFTEYENKLKSFFNVESDKKGDDLLAQIKEATTGEKTPKELTDEAVKKHPLYLQLEANTKTELQKAKTDYEKALSDKDQEYQQKDITERAVKAGMAMFDSLNPILSTDTVKAQNQRSLFEQQLRNNKYQFVEGQSGFLAFTLTQPTDSCGQSLECNFFFGQFQPALKSLVFGKHSCDDLICCGNIGWVST